MDGPQLGKITLSDPQDCLDMILDEVGRAFEPGHHPLRSERVQYHGNRSRSKDHRLASAVDSTHPHAEELLERDVANILHFFYRKYRIEMTLEDALCIRAQPEASS